MILLRRTVAAALLGPLVVLAVSAFGFIGQRCRMTGMTSLDTCCPEQDQGEPPAQSSVGEPGCCERVVVSNGKPAASPPAAPSDGLSRACWSMFLPTVTVVSPPAGLPARVALASPRVSKPPLRLLKRSLLI